jgi:hypothetical protein
LANETTDNFLEIRETLIKQVFVTSSSATKTPKYLFSLQKITSLFEFAQQEIFTEKNAKKVFSQKNVKRT